MTVAILLATYNGEKYLGEMLQSLEDQTYENFTVYIHDDGSTDGTISMLQTWIDEHQADTKKQYVLLEGAKTGSAKANFMWMLSQVESDYYMFADQDDVWLPNKVERSVIALSKLDNGKLYPACIFSDMYVVDKDLNIIDESFIQYLGRDVNNVDYTQILIDNPGAGCTYCFDKKLRDMAITLTDVSSIPMHDHFILALAAASGRVQGIDEPLLYYRQTGYNEMGAVTETKLQKVARNLKDLLNGSFKAKKMAFIAEAKNLAWVILSIDGINEDVKPVLEEFINIDGKKKSERRRFYKEHNFTRAHGNFWMRLWV